MKDVFNITLFTESVKSYMYGMMLKENRRIGVRELAEKIGVSASTISRIENGKMPDVETFFRVCRYMKMPTSRFIK